MFILWALPKLIWKERGSWVVDWILHYLTMEFTICWKSFGSGRWQERGSCRDNGDNNLTDWSSLGLDTEALVEGASIWLHGGFAKSAISTSEGRSHRSGLGCALKGTKIGWSWTLSSFDFCRGGVKMNRGFLSVSYSMFSLTRDRPDFEGPNSDASGLLGSNTRVVLT